MGVEGNTTSKKGGLDVLGVNHEKSWASYLLSSPIKT